MFNEITHEGSSPGLARAGDAVSRSPKTRPASPDHSAVLYG